jgi:hypothetical protein
MKSKTGWTRTPLRIEVPMNSSEQAAGSLRFSTKPSLKGAVSKSPATGT